MRTSVFMILGSCAALLCGCAATMPHELTDARLAYQRASAGPAVQLAPAELHTAQAALAQAEKAYSDDPKAFHTRDLAYVAQRKAQMADAQAAIAVQTNSKSAADKDFVATQGSILKDKTQTLADTRTALDASERAGQATNVQLTAEQQARLEAERKTADQEAVTRAQAQDLNQTRTALAVSEQSGQATAAQLLVEQQARLAAEKKAAEAQAALTSLAALKEEARGMVITLNGSVLFRTDEATLMPGAETRLDQVADALAGSTDRNVVVEGYTDSQGADAYNIDLSQRRANAVRDYLVRRGYPADRVQARGLGKTRPIADNATAEGRANNRRVEIVLERTTNR